MLPARFTPTPYHFFVDKRGPIRVLMVSDELANAARTTATEPFWFMEVGDESSLDAVLRWIRVRREFWNSWGQMAERAGRPALASLIAQLMKDEPPAEVVSFVMQTGSTLEELSLGEVLGTSTGLQNRIYYSHRFESERHCSSFRTWLLANDPEANGFAMLEIALNQGTAALGERMDKIAREELEKA